jgi:MFS family permease
VLAINLKLIELSDLVIGVILTATLIKRVIFTLIASLYACRIGWRNTLIIYAAFMSVSSVIFQATSNYVVLIIAALQVLLA